MIDADEAERIGLVNRVVPHAELEDTVRDIAGRLAAKPALALALAAVAPTPLFVTEAGDSLAGKPVTVEAVEAAAEIAKAAATESDVIIMDEPTAAITEGEIERLFSIIQRLREQNVTVIYISHRLREIFEIGDYVTVLRDGQHVDTRPLSEVDGRADLIKMMIGRTVFQSYTPRCAVADEVVLTAEGLGNALLDNVSFDIRKGEIGELKSQIAEIGPKVREAEFADKAAQEAAQALEEKFRQWQRDYGYREAHETCSGDCGNWMAPCLIRDHHAEFMKIMDEHEVRPLDDDAKAQILSFIRGAEAPYSVGVDVKPGDEIDVMIDRSAPGAEGLRRRSTSAPGSRWSRCSWSRARGLSGSATSTPTSSATKPAG